MSEEQLDVWCKEIDEEEQKKEEEAASHSQWLRERELRKQEIERVWRPIKPLSGAVAQKRKNSETIDNLLELESSLSEETSVTTTPVQDQPRPALSPLLTSLLKSPSQSPNVATSSILHSAITNQRPTCTNTNPMIASLLNSSTGVTVSPGLQQLVSSAIGQEQTEESETANENISSGDILDDSNLRIDELASSILIPNDSLPEMKNDVDVIISNLIENADDIVADPEQHLQLDGNGDLNLNLELEDFEESEPETKEDVEKVTEKLQIPAVDPFEFQDEPEYFEPTKTPTSKVNEPKPQSLPEQPVEKIEEKSKYDLSDDEENKPKIKEEPTEDLATKDTDPVPGSVEIVEVSVVEDDPIDKELNKSEIENIVHTNKPVQEAQESESETQIKTEPETTVVEDSPPAAPTSQGEAIQDPVAEAEPKEEATEMTADVKPPESNTVTPNFSEELYDDVSMEVKIDKSGKAKRDYSRTKKKDDKEFDMLLAIEKVHRDDNELAEESFSDYSEMEKKDSKSRIKNENDRSSSPWTEEEDILNVRNKRRLSTPATPVDSVPNSPVSSIYYYDDDKDYRNWKKSVMLVYSRLATHKYASLFAKPITDDQAPGYHSVVYRPMDLQTIRKNIESGAIKTTQEFQRDVLLMLNNAIMYNKTNDTVYDMTRQMQQEALQQIHLLLQVQSQVDTPVRRETRTSEPGSKRKRTNEENSRSKKRKED